MKKIFSLLIGVVMLSALGFGAFTASGTSGVVTKIGSTHSWYLKNTNYRSSQWQGNKAYFDIVYTAGDETSVSFTISYLYAAAAPTATTNLSYFPESDSSGQFSVMTRTLLKSVGNQRYTVAVDVPDRATYVVITFASTGGTPTGTIVIDGFMNQFN
jgi:hypothetical protein